MQNTFLNLVLDNEVESIRFVSPDLCELHYRDGSEGLIRRRYGDKWSFVCDRLDYATLGGSCMTGREF